MTSAFSNDSWAALVAWQKYAAARFFSRLVDLDIAIFYQAKEAFIVEYLMCRGWRQIPGSKEWV